MAISYSLYGPYTKERSKLIQWIRKQLIPSRKATQKSLWRYYDAGRLFFPRKHLQDLLDQIVDIQQQYDRLPPGTDCPEGQWPRIKIPSVTGRVEEYEVRLGQVTFGHFPVHLSEDEYESYCRELCPSYNCCEHLVRATSRSKFRLELPWTPLQERSSYCAIKLAHRNAFRSKATGEPVPDSVVYNNLTYSKEELLGHFARMLDEWHASAAWDDLKLVLLAHHPVIKIVAFSLGDFAYNPMLAGWQGVKNPFPKSDPPPTEEEQRQTMQQCWERSMMQHVLLIALARHLQVPAFVQDPVYTNLDVAVLAELEITVLNDPRGFLECDDQTFVLSFSSNIPVKEIIFDVVYPNTPPMMIWEKMLESSRDDEPHGTTDPVGSRIMRKIDLLYNTLPFKGSADHFGDVKVYMRRFREVPSTYSSQKNSQKNLGKNRGGGRGRDVGLG